MGEENNVFFLILLLQQNVQKAKARQINTGQPSATFAPPQQNATNKCQWQSLVCHCSRSCCLASWANLNSFGWKTSFHPDQFKYQKIKSVGSSYLFWTLDRQCARTPNTMVSSANVFHLGGPGSQADLSQLANWQNNRDIFYIQDNIWLHTKLPIRCLGALANIYIESISDNFAISWGASHLCTNTRFCEIFMARSNEISVVIVWRDLSWIFLQTSSGKTNNETRNEHPNLRGRRENRGNFCFVSFLFSDWKWRRKLNT